MQNRIATLLLLICLGLNISAQNWTLKLSSNVELRTWKLTDHIEKDEKALGGASIKLLNGTAVVSEISSRPNGDFSIDVPANGEFMLEVSYAGCNTKRFAISTKGVPGEVGNDRGFRPSFSISGFIMAKPFPGIDYSPLKNPLLKIYYIDGAKKFDNDEDATDRGLKTVSKLSSSESELAEKFCALNKAGDAALSKGDCPLAKTNYEKAIALLPGEDYPALQLPKVGDCLKQKDSDKQAIADAVAKVAADKAAKDKEESAKLAQAQADQARKQAEKQKAAEAKATPAKEKKSATPAATEKPKEVAAATTATTTPPPTSKGPIKIKPKSEQEIEKEAKQAKQREGMAKSVQEDRDAIQKDKEKAQEDYKKRQEKEAERRQKEREGQAAAEAKIIEEDKAEAAKRQEELQKEREGKAAAEAKIIEEDKAEAAKRQERLQKEREGKAAAEAKIIEEDKADAAKREEKRLKQAEEDEQRRKQELEEKRKASENAELEEGEYKVPKPLGVDKYRESVKEADELFKMKRYAEAKKKYEEALTYRAGDPYATSKLTEIASRTQPK